MLTADTITDEQICELLAAAEGIEDNDVSTARICLRALGRGPHVLSRGEAREICARILRERDAKSPSLAVTSHTVTDVILRCVRDSLPDGRDRELLTAGLVPGDCPICGSENDEPCRSGRRGAPAMDRKHWQRRALEVPRQHARTRCAEILNARAAKKPV